MTHNINDLYDRIDRQMPGYFFVHKQHMTLSHVVINVLRKPILSGPLESDIVTVQDMSEIATENNVYSVSFLLFWIFSANTDWTFSVLFWTMLLNVIPLTTKLFWSFSCLALALSA